MLNPINEMRNLKCKSYDELMQIAITKYGFCPNSKNISKIELITYIITLATMRGDMDTDTVTPKENKNENKRTRVLLEDNGGDTYYVMLTKEQIDFLNWCLEKQIDFHCMIAQEIKDTNWEMP